MQRVVLSVGSLISRTNRGGNVEWGVAKRLVKRGCSRIGHPQGPRPSQGKRRLGHSLPQRDCETGERATTSSSRVRRCA